MTETMVDPLIASVHDLRDALGAKGDADARWRDSLYEKIGRVVDVINKMVRTSDQKKAKVGEINPDFQHMPVMERKVEATRESLIKLGEQLHQLRADLRRNGGLWPQNDVQFRARAYELADAIEKVRKEDDKFVLDTVNSNPGSGE